MPLGNTYTPEIDPSLARMAKLIAEKAAKGQRAELTMKEKGKIKTEVCIENCRNRYGYFGPVDSKYIDGRSPAVKKGGRRTRHRRRSAHKKRTVHRRKHATRKRHRRRVRTRRKHRRR